MLGFMAKRCMIADDLREKSGVACGNSTGALENHDVLNRFKNNNYIIYKWDMFHSYVALPKNEFAKNHHFQW